MTLPAPVRLAEVPVASVREPRWRQGEAETTPGYRSLRASVRASGVLVPLRLRPTGEGFEVISGVLRLRAARQTGLPTLPAEIVTVDDLTALLAGWDGVVRDGLSPGARDAVLRLLLEGGVPAGEADQLLATVTREQHEGTEPSPEPASTDREAAAIVAVTGAPVAGVEGSAVRPPEQAASPAGHAGGLAPSWTRVWRLAALVVAAAAGYHFTLLTFLDNLRLDTPLAYLPLMPLFAMGTALTTVRRFRGTPRPIQDRQLDLLVGLPLMAVALLLITVVPAQMSTFYWSERPDVVSFALFVCGAVILLHGLTWLWRIRGSLVFLLLMWPALYLHAGASLLNRLADGTNAALAAALAHLPVAAAASADSSSFVVHPAARPPLLITVGSACAGGNAVLGVALLGTAVLLNRSGSRRRKAAWLCTGLVLAFAGNLVRLVSIVALAAQGHPSLALGAYHQTVGLVVFALVTAVMLAALHRFGLHRHAPLSAGEGPAARPEPRRVARWRAMAGLGMAGLLVGTIGIADHGLQVYSAYLDGTGLARVAGFGTAAAGFPGWSSQRIAAYDFQQYYGSESSSDRFMFIRRGSSPIFADVVRTPDRGALDAYTLENCFLFHNFAIRSSAHVGLVNGVVALLLDYQEPETHRRWSTLSWAWPVRQGGRTVYERVVLSVDLANGVPPPPATQDAHSPQAGGLAGVLDWLGRRSTGSGEYTASDAALVGFGRQVVSATFRA